MPDNLYKRNGVWYVRYWVDGKDARRSLRTRSRAEAVRRAKPYLDQANRIRAGDHRQEYIAAFLKWSQEVLPEYREGTRKRYLVSSRQLYPFFKDLFLDQINRRIIADYISQRKKAKVTNATIRRDLTALSRILGSAVAWGWIDTNPARSFERSVVAERRGPIVLPSDQDIDALAARARDGETFGRLVRFLQYTGMRQQEAVTLERRDIVGNYAQLRQTKTGRPRMVYLDDRALAQIPSHVERIGCPYVFWIEGRAGPGPYRNFASNFTNRVMRLHAKGKIGRRFRCHDLRHWYAVDYLRRGGDIYDLSRQLGHSSVKVTEMYLGYVGREAEPARGNLAQIPSHA